MVPAIMPSAPIKLGLDFDNTIVCYDAAIKVLAQEMFDLQPEIPRTKLGIRDYLRAEGREPEWTVFQGELYGPGMRHAQPYEGAIETMLQLEAAGHELVIVSHRSRLPYAGEPHDLHAAARGWVAERLQKIGLFRDLATTGRVNFLETRDAKLAKITEIGCSMFLDDLPEVINDPGFPASTLGVIFAPGSEVGTQEKQLRIKSWAQLPELLTNLT